MFAGPQITDVCKREKPKAIVYDQEFAELVQDAGKRRKRFVAWFDGEDGKPGLRRSAAGGPDRPRRHAPTSSRRPRRAAW